MSLIRILELPDFPKHFLFEGGVEVPFKLVDWFRNDAPMELDLSNVKDQGQLLGFLTAKGYFDPAKAYLVLNEKHSFTINYKAP